MQHRGEQRPCLLLRQALHPQLRQACQLGHLNGTSCREHQRHRFGPQPTGHERQRLRGRTIQPLRVIDHTHQRPLRRRLGQQTQRRQTDQKPIRRRAGGQPECDAQRVSLRVGQPLGPIQQRRTQLVQTGEGQLHLRLSRRGASHATPGSPADEVIQQRRLAHSGLTDHQQRSALACPNSRNQTIQRPALPTPMHRHGPAALRQARGILPAQRRRPTRTDGLAHTISAVVSLPVPADQSSCGLIEPADLCLRAGGVHMHLGSS